MNRSFNAIINITDAPPDAPPDVREFLQGQGWWSSGQYGFWNRSGDTTDYTWEQAMALEFLRFIQLGRSDAQGSERSDDDSRA